MLLTFFIAQLFGLMFIVISISLAFQKARMLEIFDDFFRGKALLFAVGVVNLAAGLLIVLSRNVWTGGTLSTAVTLLGWILAVRGIALLWMPSRTLERMYRSLDLKTHYYTLTAIVFIVGLYFVFAGFGWLIG